MGQTTTYYYRGSSGTTIDWAELERQLGTCDYLLLFDSDAEIVLARKEPIKRIVGNFQCSGHAEILRIADAAIVAIDDELLREDAEVEDLAKLLRRVLPEPAKVISSTVEYILARDFAGANRPKCSICGLGLYRAAVCRKPDCPR